MKELKRVIEVYRVDTEEEAATLIEEFKDGAATDGYFATKYESKYRNKKLKGAKVDEWYMVAIQKDFAEE